MKTTRTLALCALVGDSVLSVVLYSRLPERVPVHWNLAGQVNRYGSKLEVVLFGPLLVAGLWALMLLLSRIDPRWADRADAVDAASAEANGSYWTVIHLLLVALAFMHGAVLLAASGLLSGPNRAVAVGIALLLLLPGNFMGRLRPNWFVGIRTPWTLASDDVWRRTHRLAAVLMVGGGLLLLPLALLLPAPEALAAAVVVTLLATLGPAVWSYFVWKRERPRAPG
ncbi:MAG: SdpI family protein [Myxococcaceae bacterium]